MNFAVRTPLGKVTGSLAIGGVGGGAGFLAMLRSAVRAARLPLLTLALGCLVVPAGTLSAEPAADSTATRSASAAGEITMPIGRTREGLAIEATWQAEDLDYGTPKMRVLLVGHTAEAARRIETERMVFSRSDDAAEWRERYLVATLPNTHPAPRRATAAGRANSEPRALVFPPPGTAYNDPKHSASHYVWRWIGMHAPDLVVVVAEAPADAGDEISWFLPEASFTAWKKLRDELPAAAEGRSDELAAALMRHAACDTGTIPALRVNLPSQRGGAVLPQLFDALQKAEFTGPSPARQVLRERSRRSPVEVAEQLSRHYGRNLDQVVYIPALALIGRLRLGDLTSDRAHRRDVEAIVAPYFEGTRPTAPRSGSGLSGHLIFTELARRAEGDNRARYLALARHAADLAFDENGSLQPSMPYHHEMSDALFMGGPILAEAGQLTGDPRYRAACLRHLRFMRGLVLRDDGLYRHSPLDEAAWGRGNGFPALGLALCLTAWPESSRGAPASGDAAEDGDSAGGDESSRIAAKQFEELLKMFQDHLAALLPHQDSTGCWHQVIDRPDSYREFSCTCMITFAMARGVRHGWLDKATYTPAIQRAWRAIRARIAEDGRLVDVCTGTGKQPDLRSYYHRTAILGRDPRGGAMALLASTEMAHFEAWSRDAR